MKKRLLLTLSALVFVLVSACDGDTSPYKIDGTIIGVAPQHDTRIELIYKDPKGTIQERSTHQSEIVTDGETAVGPRDYLPIYCKKECRPFGAISGHENDFSSAQ